MSGLGRLKEVEIAMMDLLKKRGPGYRAQTSPNQWDFARVQPLRTSSSKQRSNVASRSFALYMPFT